MVKSLKLLVYIGMLAAALAVKSIPEIFGWEGFFDLRNLLCCVIAIAITMAAIVMIAIELNFIVDFRIENKNTTEEFRNKERELENQRTQLERERQAFDRDLKFFRENQQSQQEEVLNDKIPNNSRNHRGRYGDHSA